MTEKYTVAKKFAVISLREVRLRFLVGGSTIYIIRHIQIKTLPKPVAALNTTPAISRGKFHKVTLIRHFYFFITLFTQICWHVQSGLINLHLTIVLAFNLIKHHWYLFTSVVLKLVKLVKYFQLQFFCTFSKN